MKLIMYSPVWISTLSLLLMAGLVTSCRRNAVNVAPEKIISLERAALDRWGKGDPGGYLETYAPEITYFDPTRENRADGFQAMEAYYAPIVGKIKVDHYEMISPKVQPKGDVAVLSYQLLSHGLSPSGKPYVIRWNSTKVYGRFGDDWKIIHDHWSYIKPELKQPSPE